MKNINSANISNARRRAIYRRDGWGCVICSSGSHLQIHHAIPRGQGGSDFDENLVTLCAVCHAQIHGIIPLPSADFSIEEMNRTVYEYLADYYADSGDWYPYK